VLSAGESARASSSDGPAEAGAAAPAADDADSDGEGWVTRLGAGAPAAAAATAVSAAVRRAAALGTTPLGGAPGGCAGLDQIAAAAAAASADAEPGDAWASEDSRAHFGDGGRDASPPPGPPGAGEAVIAELQAARVGGGGARDQRPRGARPELAGSDCDASGGGGGGSPAPGGSPASSRRRPGGPRAGGAFSAADAPSVPQPAAPPQWAGDRPGQSSLFNGVCHKNGRWAVNIKIGRSSVYVGTYSDELEAARAWDCAAVAVRGVETRTNFPVENYSREEVAGMAVVLHERQPHLSYHWDTKGPRAMDARRAATGRGCLASAWPGATELYAAWWRGQSGAPGGGARRPGAAPLLLPPPLDRQRPGCGGAEAWHGRGLGAFGPLDGLALAASQPLVNLGLPLPLPLPLPPPDGAAPGAAPRPLPLPLPLPLQLQALAELQALADLQARAQAQPPGAPGAATPPLPPSAADALAALAAAAAGGVAGRGGRAAPPDGAPAMACPQGLGLPDADAALAAALAAGLPLPLPDAAACWEQAGGAAAPPLKRARTDGGAA
jgi:hypothetical protein